jgi:hypothetical protein
MPNIALDGTSLSIKESESYTGKLQHRMANELTAKGELSIAHLQFSERTTLLGT